MNSKGWQFLPGAAVALIAAAGMGSLGYWVGAGVDVAVGLCFIGIAIGVEFFRHQP